MWTLDVSNPVADTGEGLGGPAPPLFLDQTEARRRPKKIFGDRAPPLSEGLDPPLKLALWPTLRQKFINF